LSDATSHSIQTDTELQLELLNYLKTEQNAFGSNLSVQDAAYWCLDPKNPDRIFISKGFYHLIDTYETSAKNSIYTKLRQIDNDQSVESILFNALENTSYGLSFRDEYGREKVIQATVHFYYPENLQRRLFVLFDDVVDAYDHRPTEKSLSLQNSNMNKEVFEIAGQLANVGGWQYDIVNDQIYWSSITKEIHGVSSDYVPNLESALQFYTEGWSRGLITERVAECIETGKAFDAELMITRADDKEVWIRVMGRAEMVDGRCKTIYGAFQDIDNQKRKSQELLLAKSRYKLLYDKSPMGIVVVDTNNRLIDVNKTTKDIFGFTEESDVDFSSLTFLDVIHEDFRDKAVQLRTDLLNGNLTSYSEEFKFYRLDGSIIWLSIHSSLVSRNDGDHKIITHLTDISERKTVEEQKRRYELWFEEIFDKSPTGMAVVNMDGTWQTVNDVLPKMLGYTDKEFLALDLKDITYPDDLKKDKVELQQLIKGDIQNYSVEKRYFNKSGEVVYGKSYISRITLGERIVFIAQVLDNTDSKVSRLQFQESVQELNSLMNATSQVIIIRTDQKGKINKFNRGAEILTGYSAKEVAGSDYLETFHQRFQVKERLNDLSTQKHKELKGFDLFRCMAVDDSIEIREWDLVRKNGSAVDVHLVVNEVKNPSGEVTGYLIVAINISELKSLEDTLIKSKNVAEKANSAKSEFLANMSHEIRTPLNAVIGFSDLMMSTELTITQEHYLELINNSAKSLLGLINDVLDFSKIEAGKLKISPQWVDLIEVCGQSLDIVRYNAQKKNLNLNLKLDKAIERFIYVDPVRLRQVLTNLLSNAVKFTDKGYIELEVNYKSRLQGKKGLYEFVVRDSGRGIDKSKINKIFKAFEQEDSSITRKYGGTGLGLSISNKLLAGMDSSLLVSSTMGEGSQFSFLLTVDLNVPKDLIFKSNKRVNRVIIVHPDHLFAEILTDMTATENIECIYTDSVIEAEEIIKNSVDFDVIIANENLKTTTGSKFLKRIKREKPILSEQTEVILTYNDDEGGLRLDEKDKSLIDHFMQTPVDTYKLYSLISNERLTERKFQTTTPILSSSSGIKETYSILIAEDNPVNMFLAKSLVKRLVPKVNLIEATDGEVALRKYNELKPDLILMDIQMPIMDGLLATKKIREMDSDVPIIGLSAHTMDKDIGQGKAAGMNHYIKKPVDVDEVNTVLSNYLFNL